MTLAVLIVAAGKGTRAGGGLAKQWRPLAGRLVIDWTIEAFQRAGCGTIMVVRDPDNEHAIEALAPYPELLLADGGPSRSESVRNGLIALQEIGVERVLIHDAARPCVCPQVIQQVLDALDDTPAAAPGLAVTDALWTGADGHVTGTQDRSALFAAQTPQGFHFDAILAAHMRHDGTAADDVEVARQAGLAVRITPGDVNNIKITRPEDFSRAEHILRSTMDNIPDIRLGNGYDVHRFGPGDHVMLCGVQVPHERGLQGHSDADVGMHAVTDALYGAMAEGDIGRHFPPSDPQWKGAASDIFLRHAVELARSKGFTINNVDCTLVCEYPKVGPHAEAMRARMAEIMGMDMGRLSIKATTSERLGFTGRKEGIAALATATLVRA
ncbi:2-C-methyl-D-erythritol 4-phosphate cytidylyltransferase 2-C-methyl-D-erythritol 2,4-cyclodiphosphate synthase [Ruegeria sp. TM1040]|uniref:Bifunctional enzyme IspD/IspF n=1 Tax=Ruegeria sp. (strain TM1040) TaxID=292414 RepID=ISPDF_RUEST|nr:bifunctional 2-C-methyl-D-erythritol 4-phosphate cytidylyltransferase/2-C-methyl-D-erythritol 2,4-cyclodiphosphate synthase [Ruegeria sp. TM1040]Q1GGW9.1 RecName: Full=Bifunctional enzyme IspD/IspF; Includes: RecName: Full=2-C-methyl-D-erythritol 4-phosphate cytidylyltransferase; AltName: Full=4-diphosphocytidyl-2C-methyl-D-erythritol synthase; AltName: Full=MEP cytidylyltransferase; Short=MCT; Includes: RecName: Full=2-C-methyl-D-erythritol 2,4-cyclodiphosphate synthase; Short=MECDP-synthase; 